MYKVGERFVEIHANVIQKLMEWNLQQRSDMVLDNAFVLAILISVVPPEDFANGQISESAMDFVTGMLNFVLDFV